MLDEQRREELAEINRSRSELPTVDDCKAFLDAINAGREAAGYERLESLEYDECDPSSPVNCLSAHHLFTLPDVGESVGGKDVLVAAELRDALTLALRTEIDDSGWHLVIPPEIRRVTDWYDLTEPGGPEWDALREQFEKAGLLDD